MKTVSVTLSPELRLEQALQNAGIENPASVAKLIITGATLRKRDFEYIRKNMSETLQELDMGDVSLLRKHFPQDAFRELRGLTSITIPNSAAKFDPEILGLETCINLISVIARSDNPYFTSQDGVLFDKRMSELVFYPCGRQGDYKVPDNVNAICNFAFCKCPGLTSIHINSVFMMGRDNPGLDGVKTLKTYSR